MTRNEKGYFKKFSSGYAVNEENNYILLFDILNKQKHYDEKEVINVFKNKKNITHFSALKNYLFKLILDSLRNFYGDKNIKFQINRLIEEAHLLITKGLIPTAKNYLKKAKRMSYEYDYIPGILTAIEYEIVLCHQVKQIIHKDMTLLIKEKKNIIESLLKSEDFSSIHLSLSSEYLKTGERNEQSIESAKETLQHLKKLKLDELLSFNSKLNYCNLLYICYDLLDDMDGRKFAEHKKVLLFKEHPQILKDEEMVKVFFVALSNYANSLGISKEYKEMEATIKDMDLLLKGKTDKNLPVQARIFEAISSMKLMLYLRTGRYSESIDLLEHSLKKLNQYEKYLNTFNKTRMYYFGTLIYFASSKFDKALSLIQKTFPDKRVDIRGNIQLMSKMLEILIHIELGNTILVESLMINVYRLFYQKKGVPRSITIIWKFLNKLISVTEKAELKIVCNRAKQKLLSLSNINVEVDFMNNLLIIPYINYKLNQSSLDKEITAFYK